MHDVITVGIPLLAIFAGILLNNRDANRIENRLDRMQSDLSQFYLMLGKHDGRLDAIEKKS